MGCSSNNEKSTNDTLLTKEAFKTPLDSKVWNALSNNEDNNANEIYLSFDNEKQIYQDQLHCDNTMSMWHKALLGCSKDLTIKQVNVILDDMDAMDFNSVSFRRYYRLL